VFQLKAAPPQEVIRVNAGEQAHGPHLLPDGHYMLVTIARGNDLNRWNNAKIVLFSLSTGERRDLIEGGSDARYIPTRHLIYAHQGALLTIPFDLSSMKTTGNPVPVLEGVARSGGRMTGVMQLSMSQNGSIAYLPRADDPNPPGATGENARFLMGFADRSGEIERLNIPIGSLKSPRMLQTVSVLPLLRIWRTWLMNRP
jgi:hypothetical protein